MLPWPVDWFAHAAHTHATSSHTASIVLLLLTMQCIRWRLVVECSACKGLHIMHCLFQCRAARKLTLTAALRHPCTAQTPHHTDGSCVVKADLALCALCVSRLLMNVTAGPAVCHASHAGAQSALWLCMWSAHCLSCCGLPTLFKLP